MAIDVNSEELISLREAARLLPVRRAGKKPHVSCLYRWTTAGCRGVVLESVNVGGTRCTSRQALARFIAKSSTADRNSAHNQAPEKQRNHLINVDRELDREGIT